MKPRVGEIRFEPGSIVPKSYTKLHLNFILSNLCFLNIWDFFFTKHFYFIKIRYFLYFLVLGILHVWLPPDNWKGQIQLNELSHGDLSNLLVIMLIVSGKAAGLWARQSSLSPRLLLHSLLYWLFGVFWQVESALGPNHHDDPRHSPGPTQKEAMTIHHNLRERK